MIELWKETKVEQIVLSGQYDIAVCMEYFMRIIIAGVCGAVIGLEREKNLKDAGLRTHILVCCAAALMMLVSKYGFEDLVDAAGNGMYGTKGADPARVAAQVISGVSFLGAGVIFHNRNTVKGLNTAAGLWATAGIGVAIGAGMYEMGIFVTMFLAAVQVVVQKCVGDKDKVYTNKIVFNVRNTVEFRKKMQIFLTGKGVEVIEKHVEMSDDGTAEYTFVLRMNRDFTFDQMNDFLETNDEVISIRFGSMS